MNKLIEELYRELSFLHLDMTEDTAGSWSRVFQIIGAMKSKQEMVGEALGYNVDIELEQLSRVTPRGGL